MESIINFIKDYSWLISIVLGFLGIYLIFHFRKSDKKNITKKKFTLYYKELFYTDLQNLPYNFELVHLGRQLKTAWIFEFILGNNGNIIITNEDLVNNLVIEFGKATEIINIEFLDMTNDNMNCRLEKETIGGEDRILINFISMDVLEAIKFRVLGTSTEQYKPLLKGKFRNEVSNKNFATKNVTGLAEKLKESAIRDPYGYRGPTIGNYAFAVAGIVGSSILIFNFAQPLLLKLVNTKMNFSVQSSELVSFFLSFVFSVFAMWLFFKLFRYLIRWAKEYDPLKEIDKKYQNYPETDFGTEFNLTKK